MSNGLQRVKSIEMPQTLTWKYFSCRGNRFYQASINRQIRSGSLVDLRIRKRWLLQPGAIDVPEFRIEGISGGSRDVCGRWTTGRRLLGERLQSEQALLHSQFFLELNVCLLQFIRLKLCSGNRITRCLSVLEKTSTAMRSSG